MEYYVAPLNPFAVPTIASVSALMFCIVHNTLFTYLQTALLPLAAPPLTLIFEMFFLPQTMPMENMERLGYGHGISCR